MGEVKANNLVVAVPGFASSGQTTYSRQPVSAQSAKRAKQKAKRLAKRQALGAPVLSANLGSSSSRPDASSDAVSGFDSAPPIPPIAASPLTQEQVQALIADGIAKAQKPKAAWLASVFPVGIENICDGMDKSKQKETSEMIGAKWTKRARGRPLKRKAKTNGGDALEQKTAKKGRPRLKSKQAAIHKPKRQREANETDCEWSKRRSARSRFAPMLFSQGMPDPEMYK